MPTHPNIAQSTPSTLFSLTLTHPATLSLCTLEASLFVHFLQKSSGRGASCALPSPTCWPSETPEDAQDKGNHNTQSPGPCNDWAGRGRGVEGRSHKCYSLEA